VKGLGKEITSTLVDLLLVSWMASGLAILLIQILNTIFTPPGIESNFIVLLSLNFLPQLFGGTIAAFLFARRTRTDPVRNGLKIGTASLIFYYIMTFQVNLYIIASFFIGSYMGGMIAERVLLQADNENLN